MSHLNQAPSLNDGSQNDKLCVAAKITQSEVILVICMSLIGHRGPAGKRKRHSQYEILSSFRLMCNFGGAELDRGLAGG